MGFHLYDPDVSWHHPINRSRFGILQADRILNFFRRKMSRNKVMNLILLQHSLHLLQNRFHIMLAVEKRTFMLLIWEIFPHNRNQLMFHRQVLSTNWLELLSILDKHMLDTTTHLLKIGDEWNRTCKWVCHATVVTIIRFPDINLKKILISIRFVLFFENVIMIIGFYNADKSR